MSQDELPPLDRGSHQRKRVLRIRQHRDRGPGRRSGGVLHIPPAGCKQVGLEDARHRHRRREPVRGQARDETRCTISAIYIIMKRVLFFPNRQNVERNAAVSSKIEIHEVPGGSAGPLLATVLQNEEVRCRFTMCNPPFHQARQFFYSIFFLLSERERLNLTPLLLLGRRR